MSHNNTSVELLTDIDSTGNQAYYFIKVERSRLSDFLAMAKSKSRVNLTKYGEIVYSAYGDFPPKHIQNWARKELGWQG